MTLKTLSISAPLLETDVLKWCVDDEFSKIQETLGAGSGADNVAKVGTVLGRIKAATITVGAPAFTGTGDGVLTRATPAYSLDAQAGTYTVRLIEAAANAGNFEVIRPDGTVDGIAKVAVAYDGQVKFTIADGATDFSNAAQFTLAVTVTAPSYKYYPLDFAGTTGKQNPAAVSLAARTALDGGADQPLLVLRRGPAVVSEQGLIWPGGATADQIAAGIVALEALGIVTHTS